MVLANGRVHLTESQMAELIARRINERLTDAPADHQWEVVVDVRTGRRSEMLTTWRKHSRNQEPYLVGWREREIRKDGSPDRRTMPTHIGIWQVKPEGHPPEPHHYRNYHALYDTERELLAEQARHRIAVAQKVLDNAQMDLLNLYLDKP